MSTEATVATDTVLAWGDDEPDNDEPDNDVPPRAMISL